MVHEAVYGRCFEGKFYSSCKMWEVMIKVVIGFAIGAAILSLLSMIVPFGVPATQQKKWENQTYLQRFCGTFLGPLIFFVLILGVLAYRENHLPDSIEQAIQRNEIEYALVTDLDEIEGYDIVYMINKDSKSEQITQIIQRICQDLEMGNGQLDVSYEKNIYSVTKNGEDIGKVTVFKRKDVSLLKFSDFEWF